MVTDGLTKDAQRQLMEDHMQLLSRLLMVSAMFDMGYNDLAIDALRSDLHDKILSSPFAASVNVHKFLQEGSEIIERMREQHAKHLADGRVDTTHAEVVHVLLKRHEELMKSLGDLESAAKELIDEIKDLVKDTTNETTVH